MSMFNEDFENARRSLADHCREEAFQVFFRGNAAARTDPSKKVSEVSILSMVSSQLGLDPMSLVGFRRIGIHAILSFDKKKISDLDQVKKKLQESSLERSQYGHLEMFKKDAFTKQFRIGFEVPLTQSIEKEKLFELLSIIAKRFGDLDRIVPTKNISRFNIFYNYFPRKLLFIDSIPLDDEGKIRMKILWPVHFCISCKSFGHSSSFCPSIQLPLNEAEKTRMIPFNQKHMKILLRLKPRLRPGIFSSQEINAQQNSQQQQQEEPQQNQQKKASSDKESFPQITKQSLRQQSINFKPKQKQQQQQQQQQKPQQQQQKPQQQKKQQQTKLQSQLTKENETPSKRKRSPVTREKVQSDSPQSDDSPLHKKQFQFGTPIFSQKKSGEDILEKNLRKLREEIEKDDQERLNRLKLSETLSEEALTESENQ